jgi:hypothetical protein
MFAEQKEMLNKHFNDGVIGLIILTAFQYLIGTIGGAAYVFALIYLYGMIANPWAITVGIFFGIPAGLVLSFIAVFCARRKTRKTIGVVFYVFLYLTGQCFLGWAGSFIGSKFFSIINDAWETFGTVAGFVCGYIVGNLAISKLINYAKRSP